MALTKYKSKVDSGTGEKNEISLKDVYEWVQSRQLSGGNEGTPPPCEGVHSIGFQLEALEGYDTCQKIKITLTSPAANFGLYDWAFEIYLKTGLAYELKETIIVAGAAENLRGNNCRHTEEGGASFEEAASRGRFHFRHAGVPFICLAVFCSTAV